VLQAKKPKANQATITDHSSQSEKSLSKSSTTKAVPSSSSKQLPHPGPSAYYVSSSEAETESGSEDESSNCCVCHKFSPPALKQCTSLVIAISVNTGHICPSALRSGLCGVIVNFYVPTANKYI
jgi:hypothetical protein